MKVKKKIIIIKKTKIVKGKKIRVIVRRVRGKGKKKGGAHAASPQVTKGINLFGFTRAEMGIGESGRLAARSLETTGIPFGILNYTETNHRMDDLTWRHKEMNEARYSINLYHLNADNMRGARRFFGENVFMAPNRYRIGYWHWELPDFPEDSAAQFWLVNEVWVPTNFVLDSISKKATVPVVKIPHGIEVNVAPEYNRASFGLPDDRFLFFSMYDTQSFRERKNPQAVIEAFKMAFERNDPSVGLVLKLNNPNIHPNDAEVLRQLKEGYDNIYLISSILPKRVVNALTNCTDCFVSLHRSEGFGLGLAEAMYLGKPVIGTDWSGNTDFMNSTNSCPVSYGIVQVGGNYGPYKAHQFWANPDVRHAAGYMLKLVREPEYRRQIAEAGQRTIRSEYSPQVVGEMMKQRLLRLGLL
ncbi:glycosyltransferase family 4 protein [Paenibacillus humicola]|uniref:glycosyltransferase family 4 protein n=1 Tax=Paenibacillus humicola TaxID=3110540 RepID=UPI00237ABFFF|nr:glycosyltransferase family 4 protein [Paenibacillus humicola]